MKKIIASVFTALLISISAQAYAGGDSDWDSTSLSSGSYGVVIHNPLVNSGS